MKHRFSILLSLMIAAPAFAADLLVSLPDFALTAVTNRRVIVTGNSLPRGTASGIVVADKRAYTTDSAGEFWISNAVAGVYFFEVLAPPARTEFRVLVPETNGMVLAADNLVSAAGNSLPPDTVSWGANASDRRYILRRETNSVVFGGGVGVTASGGASASTNANVVNVDTSRALTNNDTRAVTFAGGIAGNGRAVTNITAESERPIVRPAKVNDYATYPSGGSLSNGMGYIYVDVIPLQTNWNGFSYWAGAIHHPRYGWVNPGLLCSSNGYDWQIPAGASMPWNGAVSEPGLGIVLNTNGTLYCYTERQTNGWSLLLQKTTDGVTRTAPVIVSSNAARRYDFPSAMQEPNGDISIWSTHNDGTLDVSLGIYYQRFDTTGTNLLAGPMRCNGLTNLWNQTHAAHLSVRRVGDYYYAVVKMQNTATGIVQMNPYALFSSLDATNWFMIQDTILNPVDYPKYPNYTQGPNSQGGLSSAARWWGVGLGRVRHNSGQPRFDLWAITGMDDEAFTNAHQICYYSDVAVPHARNTMHVGGIVVDNGGETLMDTRTHSQIQIGGGDNAFKIRKEYGHELTVSFGAPGLEVNKFTFGGDNGDFSFKGTGSGNGAGLTNLNPFPLTQDANFGGYNPTNIGSRIKFTGVDVSIVNGNAAEVFGSTDEVDVRVPTGFSLPSDTEHILWGQTNGETRLYSYERNGNVSRVNVLAKTAETIIHNPVVTYKGQPRTISNLLVEINVKDFGAKGDNSTNDQPAIQSAIYFASSNAGVVYIPPGTYKLDDTLRVPYMGALGLTNRMKLRADAWANTILRGPLLTNRPMIYVPGFWEQEAHFGMEGFWLKGCGEGLGTYSLLSQVPFTNVLVAIGNTNTYSATNLLGAFDTTITRCRLEYGSVGLALTNAQNLHVEDTWIQLNVRNVILAHVDSVKFQGGHYGSLLVTNRHEWLFGFNLIGTPWSTWESGRADSGVHKIFENLEHEGAFIYADGARFTVIGGQFELGQNTATPMTNGWCHLTNKGQYNFIGSTIAPPPVSGTFLFSLHNGASGGLRLQGCTINSSDDPLAANPRNYFFDIWREGTDKNFYWPYWDCGVHGSDSANEATSTVVSDFNTRTNARVDGTNYLHVKQKWGDSIQVSDFKRNGKHYVRLSAASGRDGSNRTLTNQPYAEGPSSVALSVLGSNFQGYGIAWDTNLTSFRAWAFPAFIPERNVDGTMPKNYLVKIPLLSTNVFTNFLQIDVSCLRADGGGAQISNGNGSHGYYSTTTNIQYYSSTRTFSFEPKDWVVVRFGINASAWPLTNRIYTGDPEIEYW